MSFGDDWREGNGEDSGEDDPPLLRFMVAVLILGGLGVFVYVAVLEIARQWQ